MVFFPCFINSSTYTLHFLAIFTTKKYRLFNDTHREKLVLYWIQYKNFKTTLRLRDRHVFMWQSVKVLNVFKVAPRAEKSEVFRKSWNFANRTYFASCIIRKHYFLLWTKETAFFPYIYHGIIFYSAELFDCAVNFKF